MNRLKKTALLIFLGFTAGGFQNCSSGYRAMNGDVTLLSSPPASPEPSPTPSASTPIDESRQRGFATAALLGVWNNPARLNAMLDDMISIHASWVRFDFQWQAINDVSLTSYNTQRYDAVVKAAVAKGIQILGIIDYSNSLVNGGNDQMVPPGDFKTYAIYCSFLANHFGPMGVHHWEIWNEENTVAFWNPGADAGYFTKMLKLAYPALKAADPSSFVVLGGMAPTGDDGVNQTPQTFLTGVYAAGGKNYFDAVGHHPYLYSGDDYWFSNAIPELRQIMLANNDGAKKIWLTESGSPSSGNSSLYTEAWQAQIVQHTLQLHLTLDYLGPVFIYDYMDEGTNPKDIESNFGVVHLDGSPKPAYTVFKNAE